MSETLPLVKVGFRDADGNVETLWAFDLGEGRYRLDNTPWYQYGVSCYDIVEAKPEPDGFLFVSGILEKSGYRTIRIRSKQDISDTLLKGIKAVGATYEGANRKFMAVDIPPRLALDDVIAIITASGVEWEYADPTYEQVNGMDL